MDAPVILYTCEESAGKLLDLLRARFPEQELAAESPDADWTLEVDTGTSGRIFKKELKLTFNHRPELYRGSGWPGQQSGMIGFFSQGDPPAERSSRIEHLIRSIRFAIPIVASPGLSGDDDRYALISDLARELDAFLFVPGALLDFEFRSLIELDGSFDPAAEFPSNLPDEPNEPAVAHTADGEDSAREEADGVSPPTAERVARRLLVLMAVAARSAFEMNHLENAELAQACGRLRGWLEELSLEDECEAEELEAIKTPLDQLTDRQCIDGSWRTESVAVLAWALGLRELSRYDTATQTDAILGELGFLNIEQAEAILQQATLRPQEELQAKADELLALHWRMRDFGLRPESMNFRAWGDTCWFGPTDLSWAEFGADDDLALDGTSISQAPEEEISRTMSLAMERHLAVNWLRGYGPSEVYSETDTST